MFLRTMKRKLSPWLTTYSIKDFLTEGPPKKIKKAVISEETKTKQTNDNCDANSDSNNYLSNIKKSVQNTGDIVDGDISISSIVDKNDFYSDFYLYKCCENMDKTDDDGEYFIFRQKEICNYDITREIPKNIFDMPKKHSICFYKLDHLKLFIEKNPLDELGFTRMLHSFKFITTKTGAVALLTDEANKRYIYYLVTKQHKDAEIHIKHFWDCLKEMRSHIEENNINCLLIPISDEICGIEWYKIKNIVEMLFKNTYIKVFCCPVQSVPKIALIPPEIDKEYQLYLQSPKIWNSNKITEIHKNLFEMPPFYSLAHCVAQDFCMGKGIALEFKKRFEKVQLLKKQKASVGGLAVLNDKKAISRFIYYLVTKKHSRSKPHMEDLWKSLKSMRTHIEKNGVKNLAIPTLGCGLDGLIWYEVKLMIAFLFRKVDLKIVVCKVK